MTNFIPPSAGQKNSGFTLIETIVSISIVVIISALFLANYKYANRQASLNNAAQKLASDIRLAQSYTLGSKEFNGSVPQGGWGVMINKDFPEKYLIFADIDGNHIYNINELYKEIFFPADIVFESIQGDKLDIVFYPPNPLTYINSQLNSSVSIILKNVITNQTKTVFVNFLGLVDVN